MARPEWRDASKERFWRRTLRDFRRSGLTVREFCGQRRLAEHNFYAWRRILAQRDQETRDDAVPAEVEAPRFLPVHVRHDPMPSPVVGIDVVLANGRCLRVPVGFDADLLRQLLRVVEETPTC